MADGDVFSLDSFGKDIDDFAIFENQISGFFSSGLSDEFPIQTITSTISL